MNARAGLDHCPSRVQPEGRYEDNRRHVDFSRVSGKDGGMEQEKITCKWRVARPTGLSFIIGWLGFWYGIWPVVLAMLGLNRFTNWTGEDKEFFVGNMVLGVITL